VSLVALPWPVVAEQSHAPAFSKPKVIEWGAPTAQLEKELKPLCPKLRTRKIDPPFLDNVKTEQLQIDCDDFQFRGRGRHVEFVIRDGRLVMVWLMVQPEEQDATVRDMRKALGKPAQSNGQYIVFQRDRIAWRFKPAEILFYSAELDSEVAGWFK
jgi:hypothetical protein